MTGTNPIDAWKRFLQTPQVWDGSLDSNDFPGMTVLPSQPLVTIYHFPIPTTFVAILGTDPVSLGDSDIATTPPFTLTAGSDRAPYTIGLYSGMHTFAASTIQINTPQNLSILGMGRVRLVAFVSLAMSPVSVVPF